MKKLIAFLDNIERYKPLVTRWKQRNDPDIGFELLFANQCESNGIELGYEKVVNDTEKSIDFQAEVDDFVVNFELHRVGLNEGIRELKRKNELKGYSIESDANEPHFRTAAQIIKLQWGLLEKVDKFKKPENGTINLLCIDCTNVHAGMLDEHDVAITMWGKPYHPFWTEKWEGKKLLGILEDGYNQRGYKKFRECISAVIFIPKQKAILLNGGYVALNNFQPKEHREATIKALKQLNGFESIKVCPCT
ncbi:hypothetical protein AB4622_07635 [Vibrio splendidus]